MSEKIDVEIQSLNESLDLGGLAAMQPVTLSRDREGRVTVRALGDDTIGTLDETTLSDVIQDISEWMAEIRTIRRAVDGRPAKVAIRIRKKPLNDCFDFCINDAQVNAEDEDDLDLFTTEQLLFVANECKDTFRNEALREWVNRVVEAPLEARGAIVEQMLSHPSCGPLVELLMDKVEHCNS